MQSFNKDRQSSSSCSSCSPSCSSSCFLLLLLHLVELIICNFILPYYCLAKELARRKNCRLSVSACLHVCVRGCSVRHLMLTPIRSSKLILLALMVIDISLCQTTCPLRTIHFQSYSNFFIVWNTLISPSNLLGIVQISLLSNRVTIQYNN